MSSADSSFVFSSVDGESSLSSKVGGTGVTTTDSSSGSITGGRGLGIALVEEDFFSAGVDAGPPNF